MQTSICSSGIRNRWWASMTSSPLFIIVAESTVIFGPIDQRGWLSACSTVTRSRSSSGCAQNGPPLAVMIRRRTDSRFSPHRHCQIALCSESTVLIPRSPAARMTRSPAMTRTSLVARATSFPALSAAMVGARARAPGMARTTTLMGRLIGAPANSRRSLRICGDFSFEEVESHGVEEDEDRGKQDRVEAVERAAMSGNQVGRVLDLGDALHLRLHQVAGLGADANEQAEGDRVQQRQPEDESDTDDHHDDRAGHARDRTFDRLARTDRAEEWTPSNPAADQKRRGVARDDGEDREQRPRQPVVRRRVQQEVEVEGNADVQGAGHAHRPSPNALAPARDHEERREAAHHRDAQDQRDVDRLEQSPAVSEEIAKREQQPGGSAIAHAFRQADELPKRKARENEDKNVGAGSPGQGEADDDPQDDERGKDAHHQSARLPPAR